MTRLFGLRLFSWVDKLVCFNEDLKILNSLRASGLNRKLSVFASKKTNMFGFRLFLGKSKTLVPIKI